MAKTSALVFGIIFLVVGIWGYFQMPILGLFDVNGLHNLVHLVFGIILVVVALKAAGKAASTLKWTGIIYLLLAIVGFIWGLSFVAIPAGNSADNWLHLVLGLVIGGVGFAAAKKNDGMASPAAPMAPQM